MAHDDRLPFQRRHLPHGTGGLLSAAREARGLSRREVAIAVGIAPRTLARIERGDQKPLYPTLDRLCAELAIWTSSVAPRWVADEVDLPSNPVVAPGLGLRALRLARGITLVEMARLAGVAPATLLRFERGMTASRLLTRRIGGPGVAFEDRDLVLHSDTLAKELGLPDSGALHAACLAAAGWTPYAGFTDGSGDP